MTREEAIEWAAKYISRRARKSHIEHMVNKFYDECEKANKEIYESAYNQGYADAKCGLALSKDDGEYRAGKALKGETNGGLF